MAISLRGYGQLIKEDKAAHYVAGTICGVPTYLFVKDQFNLTPTEGVLVTTGLGGLVAWGFEHYQKSTGRGVYDKNDIWAGVIGAATGAMLAEVIRHKPETYKQRQLRKQKKKERRLQRKLKKDD